MIGLACMRRYLRLFTWFSLRHLGSQWARTLAVLLGIALGAAVFTSVRLAVHATLESFTQSMDRIAGGSDLTLIHPGGRVPDHLTTALMRHPAVRTAAPVLSTYVRPADRETPFLLIGLDPILDRDLRSWTVKASDTARLRKWSDLIAQPGSMVIGQRLSRDFDWMPGQKVQVTHSNRTASFIVLATLAPDGLALVEGERIALCDIATFQELTGLFGQVDRIDLKLAAGTTTETAASLAELLPRGVVIGSPSARSESGRGMIRAYQISLTFLSFISLFVGMFLVYSLVALNAAKRRPELAAMRAMGASQTMLFALFVGEGAFIGLGGWLLAIPFSSLLVPYLLAGVSRTVSMLFVRVPVDQMPLSSWEVLVSFGVTIAVAMLAALQPAREAMQVQPREALDVDPAAILRTRPIHSMARTGVGLLLLVYPIARLPSPLAISLPGYLAALFLFLGFALMTPLLLRYFGGFLAPILLRLGGQPAFMAARYLRQSGVQTAISVGALITAVALFTALVVMIHSFRGTVALWVQQSIAGDLYIRPKLAELNRFRDPLPARAVATIQALPMPVRLVPIRRMELRVNGHTHIFEAMDYDRYAQRSGFVWMGGNTERIEADLIAGNGVVVSEVFANITGLKPGDRYRVQIGSQLLDEPILGVFRDYRTRGGAVYYSLTRYQKRFSDQEWSGVQVNFPVAAPDLTAAMDKAKSLIQACCGEVLEMVEGSRLRRAVLQIFDETFAITTVLLLIALAVAALGIATTLAILVLQRQRQLNTIRAIGGNTGQLRCMILWEAGLIVLTGQTAGLICGFILSIILIYVVNLQSFGWTFIYRVDWVNLATALPLIFAAALAAALPAVRLALNTSPATLLKSGMK